MEERVLGHAIGDRGRESFHFVRLFVGRFSSYFSFIAARVRCGCVCFGVLQFYVKLCVHYWNLYVFFICVNSFLEITNRTSLHVAFSLVTLLKGWDSTAYGYSSAGHNSQVNGFFFQELLLETTQSENLIIIMVFFVFEFNWGWVERRGTLLAMWHVFLSFATPR